MACHACRLKKKPPPPPRKRVKTHGARPKRIRTTKFTWRDLYGCGC